MTTSRASLAPELLAFQAAVAGRYSIDHELGRGSVGIVSLAREVALDRPVALKLLTPEMTESPGVKDRFLEEARIAAGLSHPNIVQIYAVDVADDFAFFAMAYVDGGTLGDRVREHGPLSNADAVQMLREVSWALGHAHVQGVVHRDVKPDNILLDQESGRAMVTDFGIDALAPHGGAAGQTGGAGTADFTSPEQANGRAVDARSDLYSLACVGFYALSGKVPFTGPSPDAILVAHVNEPPPPVRSVAPHVPPGVATALDRCLRKDPDHRFSRGEALADALEPDGETDRELAIPLRVFIKESRELESTLSYSLAGLVTALPGVALAIGVGAPAWVVPALIGVIAGSLALPAVSLVRSVRRLLESGFTQSDATVAFLRDIDRKEEEYRFQVGERVTRVDRAARLLKLGGFSAGGGFFSLAIMAAMAFASDYLVVGIDPNSFDFLIAFGLFSFNAGITGLYIQELRARRRGDVMGERFLRFWKSKLGEKLFKLAELNLRRVAPALGAGSHRATEVVIGLEADRLFEELPEDTRKSLGPLPETVQALEEDAGAMRRQVAEMDGVLAEMGDDDPSRPSAAERARVRASLESKRGEAKEKLREAVAALETIRLGLLYMQAGTGTVESLTMELEAARGISDDMEGLLEGRREVDRILKKRRRTGVFTLVTDPG